MTFAKLSAKTLPNPKFTAQLAQIKGRLYPYGDAWKDSEGNCPVLQSTPLNGCYWAILQAYMQRRFGLGSMSGDGYKDLGAGWLLDTPHPEVFVAVRPSMSGPEYSFTVYVTDETLWRQRQLSERGEEGEDGEKEPSERIQAIMQAYQATLLDLLRPVNVRDHYLNAIAEVEDDDELLDYSDNDETALYAVPYHPSSGFGMPQGLFGGENWARLCQMLDAVGEGDFQKGLGCAIEHLRAPILENLRHEPWEVLSLVLLFAPQEHFAHWAERAGLVGRQEIAELREERSAIRVGGRTALLEDADVEQSAVPAQALLRRLGVLGANIPRAIKDNAARAAFEEFAQASPGGKLPQDLLDAMQGVDEADFVAKFQEQARALSYPAIASWAERVAARPFGAQALRRVFVMNVGLAGLGQGAD